MSLILHVDSNSTPYDVIAALPTPESTATHKPVAHVVMIDLIRKVATEKGYQITREQFGINRDGSKLFGVIDFSNTNADGNEYRYSIGFRNSHNKALSFGLVAGGRVTVCDNLMFQGDWGISRKHTSGIDPERVVRAAFEMMPGAWNKLKVGIEKLKSQYISLEEASRIILSAATQDILPAADAVKVFEEFQNPSHDDFKPMTKWSLYNAFTEINKTAPSMARSNKTLTGLAAIFGLNQDDVDSIKYDPIDSDEVEPQLNNAASLNQQLELQLETAIEVDEDEDDNDGHRRSNGMYELSRNTYPLSYY
jgi:Domain of unknown function (DUF932)